MAKGCGANCARIILIIFNIIFWLTGAALLGLGLYIIFSENFDLPFQFVSYVDDLVPYQSGSLLRIAAYAFIGIGSFVLIVGFCGCCGAIKENKCLLGIYIFFLAIIMIAEFAIAGAVLYFREEIQDAASDAFVDVVANEWDDDADVRGVINAFQVQFECCGWSGYEDFANLTDGIVPSCCKLREDAMVEDYAAMNFSFVADEAACKAMTDTAIYGNCNQALQEEIKESAVLLIGVGLGIGCLELFGMIFACCLCRSIEE